MMFAWSVIYPAKGEHSQERELPLSTLTLLDFTDQNIAIVTSVNETQQ